MAEQKQENTERSAVAPAAEKAEDRHGETTGVISFNMVLVFLPTTIWCFAIGPWLTDQVWVVMLGGLVTAIGLSVLALPVSRRLWAMFSDYADRV
ncbi:MAG: hypothetical protein R3336_07545 [Phycisphaeraceae bacterium]|nr:hypothetical protein [Phycisphaeraceae bacterium]